MAERENNIRVEKEKDIRKKIILIVTAALVCFIAIFAMVKVYTSPARQLQRQLDLGNRYLEEMDYEQAIVAFDKVIEIDQMNADAYMGKADAYVGLGNIEAAIAVLEEGYDLTRSDEILKWLEELWGSSGGAAYTATGGNMANETAEGESGIPYFELGFSPEDFTIAGYSIMDGNHLDDVERAVATEMPSGDNNEAIMSGRYVGWNYGKYEYSETSESEDRIELYYNNENHWSGVVGYMADNLGVGLDVSTVGMEIRVGITINEFPLYEGKVVPNVTSFEETLNILGIEQLIPDANTGYVMFDSQYGCGECYKIIEGTNEGISVDRYNIIFRESEIPWKLSVGFCNNILCDIELRSGGMLNY